MKDALRRMLREKKFVPEHFLQDGIEFYPELGIVSLKKLILDRDEFQVHLGEEPASYRRDILLSPSEWDDYFGEFRF